MSVRLARNAEVVVEGNVEAGVSRACSTLAKLGLDHIGSKSKHTLRTLSALYTIAWHFCAAKIKQSRKLKIGPETAAMISLHVRAEGDNTTIAVATTANPNSALQGYWRSITSTSLSRSSSTAFSRQSRKT